MADKDVFEFSEPWARAKLARIIRNSEAGWLFYSPGGTAYHIYSEEADSLPRKGKRRLKKLNWLAAELSGLPKKSLIAAFAAFGVSLLGGIAAGKAFTDPYGDFLLGYAVPTFVLFALFFAFLRPLIMLAIRATYMMVWQAGEAKKLKREGRGAVPDGIEKKHLRYNLFRMIFWGALAILSVRFVMMWFMTPSQVSARGFELDIILIGVMVVSSIPAGMIDATHVRRKWLD